MTPLHSFRCLGCGYEFRRQAGPVECPACDHLYVENLSMPKPVYWAHYFGREEVEDG